MQLSWFSMIAVEIEIYEGFKVKIYYLAFIVVTFLYKLKGV